VFYSNSIHFSPDSSDEKPLFGVIAAMEISLPTIRQECPHFNEWLERLESLPTLLFSQA
jgi:hypothetical protein